MDDDITITGPTIEEATYKYAPYSSIHDIDTVMIPDKFRDEFKTRLDTILQLQQMKNDVALD